MAKAGAFGILLTMIWVTVAAGAAVKNHAALPGRDFFKTIPNYERPDYLAFELSRGYITAKSSNFVRGHLDFPEDLNIPEYRVNRFQALDVPENFTENLFNFVQTEFNLDQTGIRTFILERTVCFEHGQCINLDDLGSLCCPF